MSRSILLVFGLVVLALTAESQAQSAKPANPITTFNDPPFQAWMKETSALPAEKQAQAVAKKMQELNPGFDGRMRHVIQSEGSVTQLTFICDNITDISPVRALAGLKLLRFHGSGEGKGQLSDLSPLQGMRLTGLECWDTNVSDLSPLTGMPLKSLAILSTKVADLSPLQGMRLTKLQCNKTLVSDLTPLKGMKLDFLYCEGTQITDLSPLDQCTSLIILNVKHNKLDPATVAALQKAVPKCNISWDGATGPITTVNDPAFQQWMADVAVLPAEKQVESVSKKLMELNPRFDGKVTPKIDNGVVTEVLLFTDRIRDISPVRALTGLTFLSCQSQYPARGMLADLSPLQGLHLTQLDCQKTLVSDLTPLKGMPLTDLRCNGTGISDLSPLEGMKLTTLICDYTRVSDLSPLEGMPLATLHCVHVRVSDLSPLTRMPLVELDCGINKISDLTPLEHCKSLTNLNVAKTNVTATTVAALQKALPNCKIDWADPAKPKTPEPAASDRK